MYIEKVKIWNCLQFAKKHSKNKFKLLSMSKQLGLLVKIVFVGFYYGPLNYMLDLVFLQQIIYEK